MNEKSVSPPPLIAIIPVVVLIVFLGIVIALFGSDSLNGGSQIALLMGMSVCVCLSMAIYKVRWRTFEEQIKKTIGGVAATLLILLCVGMLSGSWMKSGIVPTLIYYGIQIMSPPDFIVHYLCFGVLALRQLVDNDCHNRSSSAGYRTRPWSI